MGVTAIYNTIGKTYDITRKPDIEIVETLIKLLDKKPHGKYLDIGCGSGNYTGALAVNGLDMQGIDISDEMLGKARKKFPFIPFYPGDAKNLPLESSIFDGATCILATHHFHDIKKAFQEAFRVIRKGKFVIFTSTPEQMKNYWLGHYFPELLEISIRAMASFNEIKQALEQAGFFSVQSFPFFVTNNLQDLFLQSGKYRPEIYLDQDVRNGISSFHLLSNQDELQQGLKNLKNDIRSGEIRKIIEKYESKLGDYLFVTGEK